MLYYVTDDKRMFFVVVDVAYGVIVGIAQPTTWSHLTSEKRYPWECISHLIVAHIWESALVHAAASAAAALVPTVLSYTAPRKRLDDFAPGNTSGKRVWQIKSTPSFKDIAYLFLGTRGIIVETYRSAWLLFSAASAVVRFRRIAIALCPRRGSGVWEAIDVINPVTCRSCCQLRNRITTIIKTERWPLFPDNWRKAERTGLWVCCCGICFVWRICLFSM